MPAIGVKGYRSFNRNLANKSKTKKKKKPSIKGTRTHEELMDSIARAGRTVKGGAIGSQTASQRSKAPYKASGPKKAPPPSYEGGLTGTGRVLAPDAARRPGARSDLKVTDLTKKKKGGKSLMSRVYSAVDKSVFGGALPGGAKRGMDKLVAETSAASKDAKKKKKRRRRTGPGRRPGRR